MLATLKKFYKEIFNREVNLSHLYPKEKKINYQNFLHKMKLKNY